MRDHLKPEDLVGALRDRNQMPVPGRGGRSFKHLQEVREATSSLDRAMASLLGAVLDGGAQDRELRDRLIEEMFALAETAARIRRIVP